MSVETEAIQKQKAKQAEPAPQAAPGTETPQTSMIGELGNSDATVQAHAAQLGNEQFPTAQRQTLARQIGDVGGNRYVQRVMEHVQRQPATQQPAPQVDPLLVDFENALRVWVSDFNAKKTDFDALRTIVNDFARRLWEAGKDKVKQAASGATTPTDLDEDKWLYDTRLQMIGMLERGCTQVLPQATQELDELKQIFERGSRGVLDESQGFTGGENVKKVLISGFDPFGQGTPTPNPSGAAALALDGERLQIPPTDSTAPAIEIEIQSVLFPVRWEDFDEGIVQNYLGAYVQQRDDISMILGIGQGRSSYEIEAEASNSRFNLEDNAGETGSTGPIGTDPFKENTLPQNVKDELLSSQGVTEHTNHDIESGDQDGDHTPNEDFGTPGGYLCNELMYRSLDYVEQSGKSIPVGFLHVPAVNSTVKTTDIINKVREILQTSVAAMP